MKIRLIHWNAQEGRLRAAALRRAGMKTVFGPCAPGLLKAMMSRPPSAVVIDLSRLPMQGRDVAIALRHRAGSRQVPIVFVEGDPVKAARIREQVPGAVFCSWETIDGSLRAALSAPPKRVPKPASVLAGYSGTPLPRKLGIREGRRVALRGAPQGFEDVLGELPEGAVVGRSGRGAADITLWFVRSTAELRRGIRAKFSAAARGGLWIVWPKKASGVVCDLSETIVRETGLASGLVDFKIASIDATWSGLRFSQARRR